MNANLIVLPSFLLLVVAASPAPRDGLSAARADARRYEPDPERFRPVLGHFCTGITIITASHDGEPVGFPIRGAYPINALMRSCSASGPQVSAAVGVAGRERAVRAETVGLDVNCL